MTKITLNNIANLIDATTAVNTINANNSTVQTAMDNTVSRDGTQPNSMNASLDMNSNQILNLPAPTSNNSPLRLSDLSLFNSGGSIVAIPTGGNAGDALVKNSNINYDIKWGADSGLLTGGTNIAITGTSPAVVSTIASPTFSHITAEGVTSTGATGTGNLVFSNSPTLSNVPISSLANQAAWTFLVNNTSGAAGPTAQTIDGLTLKTSPVAGDEVIIWDVAGAMLKKATVAGIGTTSGVSSIAGNVGAFTLNYPISNSTNAIVYAGPTNSGQLTFTSTTALAFKPYNGDTIKINGTIFQIPSAGIAGLGSPISVFLNGVAGQSLVAATTYFIYAFNNSGTITADFSTTGHSSSATAGNIGVEIKTGDDTRSLIGMVCRAKFYNKYLSKFYCNCFRDVGRRGIYDSYCWRLYM